MGYDDRKNTELETLDKYEKQVEELIKLLEGGMWERDAAKMAAIPISTYNYWKKNIPDFKNKVELAILTYKKNLIKAVNINTVKSGKIALEVLKTRWGKEWNIPKKLQVNDAREETKKQINIILGIAKEDDIDEGEVQGVSGDAEEPAS
jgi:hypothetical protein